MILWNDDYKDIRSMDNYDGKAFNPPFKHGI